MQYIRRVDERPLYGDGVGRAELWDFSRANQNEESRIEAVATVASICYGRPPRDAKRLVERLWTESGGLPSSAFEFVRWGGSDDCSDSISESLRNDPDMPVYNAGQNNIEESERVHRETIATFRARIPIFVARQLLRHRTFSPQELSRRYVDDRRMPLMFWFPEEEEVGETAMMLFKLAYSVEEWMYKVLRKLKVRAEIARAVLGVGLYTELWLMGDAPALENYFELRLDKHAQKEHRELAEAMLNLLEEHQPELWRKVRPNEV